MRSLVVFACYPIILASVGSAETNSSKTRNTYVPSQVIVEIRGRLEVVGMFRTNWHDALWNSTGAVILAPGNEHVGSRGVKPDEKKRRGVYWELFLGRNEALVDVAKRLNGKSVVVKGHLFVFVRETVNAQPVEKFVVKVTSLVLGRPKK